MQQGRACGWATHVQDSRRRPSMRARQRVQQVSRVRWLALLCQARRRAALRISRLSKSGACGWRSTVRCSRRRQTLQASRLPQVGTRRRRRLLREPRWRQALCGGWLPQIGSFWRRTLLHAPRRRPSVRRGGTPSRLQQFDYFSVEEQPSREEETPGVSSQQSTKAFRPAFARLDIVGEQGAGTTPPEPKPIQLTAAQAEKYAKLLKTRKYILMEYARMQ